MTTKRDDFVHFFVSAVLLLFAFMPTNPLLLLGGMRKYLSLAAQVGCLYWGLAFYNKLDLKMDFYLLLLAAFQLELIASAAMQHVNFKPAGRTALQVLSVSVLACSMIRRNPKAFLNAWIVVFIIYAMVNLYYRLPNHPIDILEETGPIYYLGSDNEATSPLLTLFTMSILYIAFFGMSTLSLIGLFLPFFTAFFTRCGTAVMAYTLFIALFVLYRCLLSKKAKQWLIRPSTFFVAIGLYYFVIWSITLSKLTVVGEWIAKLTGKNAVTFTNRDVIWIEAIRIIRKHMAFGIGYGKGAGGNGVYVNGFYFGAHNLILQWGVYGGCVAISLFLILLWWILHRCTKMPLPVRATAYGCILLYLVAMSMENYANGAHLLPMLAVINALSLISVPKAWMYQGIIAYTKSIEKK